MRHTPRTSVIATLDGARFLTVTTANGPRCVNLAQVIFLAPEPDGRTHIRFASGFSLVVHEDFDALARVIGWEPDLAVAS